MNRVERPLGERAQAMIDALASITAEPGKLTRLYLTPEHKRAAAMVGDWMRAVGLTVRMDAAGTMHGVLPAGRAGPGSNRRLLVGSHIDTVVDAAFGVVDNQRGTPGRTITAIDALKPVSGKHFPSIPLGDVDAFRHLLTPCAGRNPRGNRPRFPWARMNRR